MLIVVGVVVFVGLVGMIACGLAAAAMLDDVACLPEWKAVPAEEAGLGQVEAEALSAACRVPSVRVHAAHVDVEA